MAESKCPACGEPMRVPKPEELVAPPEFYETFTVSICDRRHANGNLGHMVIDARRD